MCFVNELVILRTEIFHTSSFRFKLEMLKTTEQISYSYFSFVPLGWKHNGSIFIDIIGFWVNYDPYWA